MPVPASKSRNNCCVVGCTSSYKNSADTKFYGFPSKPYEIERRATWIRLVRRCNGDGTAWAPTRNSKICSKHFAGNAKRNEQAHPSYNPSIFPSVYRKRVVSGIAERHDRQLRRDAQQRVSMPRTHAPEVHMTMEDQATEQSAPLSFTADACTMTEEEGTLFSPFTMFLCCNVGQDAATFVCHNVTKDKGSGPDQVSFQDKGVGPAYKEPCFTGYDCVRHDEAKLIVRSCTWTRFVQTQQ